MTPLILTILGRPGSGKGTQAKLLVEKFNLEYFGSGDALRKRRRKKDFTGRKLIEVMEKGELVPSFVVSKIWIDKLEQLKDNRNFNGLVSDGSPRKLIEAWLFNEALKWYEWDKRARVILIDISAKESMKRLTKRRICVDCRKNIPYVGEFKNLKKCDKCGGRLIHRTDDKPAAIKKRLQEFENEVVQVLNYYKKQERLIKINGEQPIEGVFKEILKKIK